MKTGLFRKAALERLSTPERLDSLMEIVVPRAWLALLGLVAVLAAALAWGIFGSVPKSVDAVGVLNPSHAGSGSPRNAVLFASWKSQSLEPGSPVRLSVAGYPWEEHGFLLGRIVSVSTGATSVSEIAAILRDDRLARALTEEGRVHRVFITLESGGRSATGFRWSAGLGPRVLPAAGSRVRSRLEISRTRPIALVLPTLRDWLDR